VLWAFILSSSFFCSPFSLCKWSDLSRPPGSSPNFDRTQRKKLIQIRFLYNIYSIPKWR
jgi:hypothetical protein